MFAIDYKDLGHAGQRPARSGHGRDRRRPVTVPEGTSVMRAAALAGVQVPKLCATDTLKAFGSCRLCLVGDRRPQRLSRLVHDHRGGRA